MRISALSTAPQPASSGTKPDRQSRQAFAGEEDGFFKQTHAPTSASLLHMLNRNHVDALDLNDLQNAIAEYRYRDTSRPGFRNYQRRWHQAVRGRLDAMVTEQLIRNADFLAGKTWLRVFPTKRDIQKAITLYDIAATCGDPGRRAEALDKLRPLAPDLAPPIFAKRISYPSLHLDYSLLRRLPRTPLTRATRTQIEKMPGPDLARHIAQMVSHTSGKPLETTMVTFMLSRLQHAAQASSTISPYADTHPGRLYQEASIAVLNRAEELSGLVSPSSLVDVPNVGMLQHPHDASDLALKEAVAAPDVDGESQAFQLACALLDFGEPTHRLDVEALYDHLLPVMQTRMHAAPLEKPDLPGSEDAWHWP